MMISGAFRSINRFSRLFRLMTRRYRSFRSDVANRPPSRGTSGRSSGGMTGTTSRIIQSGWLPDFRNASITLRRFTIFFRFWTEVSPSIWARRSRASESRSMSRRSSRIACAHADLQGFGAVLFLELARLVDRHQVLLLDALEAGIEDDVLLEIEDLLQLAQ